MISDLTKLKIPAVTSTLSFNILLHVTILFTILSLFFTNYIAKISSKIINNEMKHIVEDNIGNSIESLNTMKDKLVDNLNLQNNLIEQFENSDDNNNKTILQKQIEKTYNIINNLKDKVKLDSIKTYFPYDYYHSLFSEEDIMRQSINNEVFFYIKFTNILLVVILLLFTFYLLKTNSITMDQIKEIGIENILTFIFIGAVEFLFFTNVAIKYIPIDPSLISNSLMDFLRK